MHFDVDKMAIGILLGGLFLIGLLKNFLFPDPISPSLAFSRVKDLIFSSWRSRLISTPQKFHFAALASFMIAFIDPHLLFHKSSFSDKQNLPTPEIPTEGLAIYLVLDQSGSMQ